MNRLKLGNEISSIGTQLEFNHMNTTDTLSNLNLCFNNKNKIYQNNNIVNNNNFNGVSNPDQENNLKNNYNYSSINNQESTNLKLNQNNNNELMKKQCQDESYINEEKYMKENKDTMKDINYRFLNPYNKDAIQYKDNISKIGLINNNSCINNIPLSTSLDLLQKNNTNQNNNLNINQGCLKDKIDFNEEYRRILNNKGIKNTNFIKDRPGMDYRLEKQIIPREESPHIIIKNKLPQNNMNSFMNSINENSLKILETIEKTNNTAIKSSTNITNLNNSNYSNNHFNSTNIIFDHKDKKRNSNNNLNEYLLDKKSLNSSDNESVISDISRNIDIKSKKLNSNKNTSIKPNFVSTRNELLLKRNNLSGNSYNAPLSSFIEHNNIIMSNTINNQKKIQTSVSLTSVNSMINNRSSHNSSFYSNKKKIEKYEISENEISKKSSNSSLVNITKNYTNQNSIINKNINNINKKEKGKLIKQKYLPKKDRIIKEELSSKLTLINLKNKTNESIISNTSNVSKKEEKLEETNNDKNYKRIKENSDKMDIDYEAKIIESNIEVSNKKKIERDIENPFKNCSENEFKITFINESDNNKNDLVYFDEEIELFGTPNKNSSDEETAIIEIEDRSELDKKDIFIICDDKIVSNRNDKNLFEKSTTNQVSINKNEDLLIEIIKDYKSSCENTNDNYITNKHQFHNLRKESKKENLNKDLRLSSPSIEDHKFNFNNREKVLRNSANRNIIDNRDDTEAQINSNKINEDLSNKSLNIDNSQNIKKKINFENFNNSYSNNNNNMFLNTKDNMTKEYLILNSNMNKSLVLPKINILRKASGINITRHNKEEINIENSIDFSIATANSNLINNDSYLNLNKKNLIESENEFDKYKQNIKFHISDSKTKNHGNFDFNAKREIKFKKEDPNYPNTRGSKNKSNNSINEIPKVYLNNSIQINFASEGEKLLNSSGRQIVFEKDIKPYSPADIKNYNPKLDKNRNFISNKDNYYQDQLCLKKNLGKDPTRHFGKKMKFTTFQQYLQSKNSIKQKQRNNNLCINEDYRALNSNCNTDDIRSNTNDDMDNYNIINNNKNEFFGYLNKINNEKNMINIQKIKNKKDERTINLKNKLDIINTSLKNNIGKYKL